MNDNVFKEVRKFKKKYPMTIAWRLRKNSKIVDMHLNPDEEVKYAFACQKNSSVLDIISTYVVVITNKRMLLGQKRLLFGYFFTSITPDLFNDVKVRMGIIWGSVVVDTVKEEVYLSKIQRCALDEIETNVTEYMMEEKKKYGLKS